MKEFSFAYDAVPPSSVLKVKSSANIGLGYSNLSLESGLQSCPSLRAQSLTGAGALFYATRALACSTSKLTVTFIAQDQVWSQLRHRKVAAAGPTLDVRNSWTNQTLWTPAPSFPRPLWSGPQWDLLPFEAAPFDAAQSVSYKLVRTNSVQML